jgi:5'-nucleotidase / UDP-sugar diphosphatase
MTKCLKYLMILVSVFICSNTAHADKREISIIHTNDLHSHFLGFSPNQDYTPESVQDDDTVGGFARISTLIKNIKTQRPGPVLVLDGGDFLMGSFFHMLTREKAFEIELLGKMGYDAVTLGNHEFDLKPKGLAQILDAAQTHDKVPAILLANMVFSQESTEDDSLEQAFIENRITPYTIIEKQGIKFGIFGLMGLDAAEKAPFSKPVSFGDPVATAQKMVAILKDKTDMIICLSHSGLDPDKKKSEDELLAEQVDGIDVIISGHTHTRLDAPITINNTVIVQSWAYGKQMGHLQLTLENEKIDISGYQAISIDDQIPGDPQISDLINTYEEQIDREILKDHGLSFRKIVAQTDFDLKIKTAESPLGNFITDAIRFVRQETASDFNPFADVAIISNGVIRDNLLKGKTNSIQACDLFRALPLGIGLDGSLGYPLISMYITPLELKKGFEVLTSIYPAKGADYFLQIAGAKFTYNPKRIMFDRVTDIWTGDEENGYKRLDFSKSNNTLIRVTADIYNSTFLKVIGGYTYNILEIIPKDKNGIPLETLSAAVIDGDKTLEGIQELKEWNAPFEYLQSLADPAGGGIPKIPERYSQPLGRIIAAPSLNPVNLVRNGTWVTWTAVGILAFGTLLSLAIVGLVRKRFKPGTK